MGHVVRAVTARGGTVVVKLAAKLCGFVVRVPLNGQIFDGFKNEIFENLALMRVKQRYS